MQKPSETTDDSWVYVTSTFRREERTERSGKWLVFSALGEQDHAWEVISASTESDELGFASKAATFVDNPRQSNAKELPICVYTYDSSDLVDVTRVFDQLRQLGFTQRLFYKTDDDTRAGRYANGVSLYFSPPGSSTFR